MPETTLGIWIQLIASAFLAGVMNAVAGGGTLLTFPSLSAVMSLVSANATSTSALMPGSFAGVWGFRKELATVWNLALWLVPTSLVGGILGAILLVKLPEAVFKVVVPWLILLATVLFLVQKPIVHWLKSKQTDVMPLATRPNGVLFLTQFLVGVYGGYFGAGIGILMLSTLCFIPGIKLTQANALKAFLAAMMNLMAVLVFLGSGKIVWGFALPMALFAIVGGYLGARLALFLPEWLVRTTVVGIGIYMAAYLYLKE